MRLFVRSLMACALAGPVLGSDFAPAVQSTNAFGVALYQQVAGSPGNLCLSPYSISQALAMTLAGAEGRDPRGNAPRAEVAA